MAEHRHFDTVLTSAPDGRMYLPLPFDPASIWGKTRHFGGALNSQHFRGVLESFDGRPGLTVSPMWMRDCGFSAGDTISVILTAEGPIGVELAPDIAAAFAAEPKAAAFWDEIAPFYRKAYIKWVNSTKGKPAVRAARIAELVGLLKGGVKTRPK